MTAFDATTEDRLREIGGMKWSLYPEATGMFVAEMDFGVAEPVRAAVQGAVDDALFGYPPPRIVDALSAACAAWQRDRYGWDVPAERVRPLADVLTGLTAAIELFTAPGSAIILPTPAYMPFLTVPATVGREVIEVPMLLEDGELVLDLNGIDRAFAAGGGMLILCNPHNPVGRVYRPDEMGAVAEIVERHGGRVFSDEIHAPLVYEGTRHTPYASVSPMTAAHTITAASASKAWNLPGLKCAQAHPLQRRGCRGLGRLREGALHRARGQHPRHPRQHGRVRRRRPVAGRGPGLPRRQPPAARRARRRASARGRPPPARRHLPGLAGLPRARPRRSPRRLLPGAGAGGVHRRRGLRAGRRRAPPAELRDTPPDPARRHRADGPGPVRPLSPDRVADYMTLLWLSPPLVHACATGVA
ncbi:aminotransferase class I/II-fold pyridoxal phosphate-dependent enzyme [Microbacterium elymi]|uniref:aminotransferase class I/II-fold pyridoxal phosphate-dependent enzyme n=1 Tax=Microbacterium elymi TaxID=2909587 RepID=UPI00338DF825